MLFLFHIGPRRRGEYSRCVSTSQCRESSKSGRMAYASTASGRQTGYGVRGSESGTGHTSHDSSVSGTVRLYEDRSACNRAT